MTCVTWRDRKPVSVLATTPTSKTDQSVAQHSVRVKGTWEKRDFAKPGVINLYNTYMGGVDLSDQRAVSYARLMRGVVWYFKVFFYMIEVCISNTNILHCKSPNHASISSLEFRKSVLIAPFSNMRTLKFKAQPTNAFFAAVNQMFAGSSQLSTAAERAMIKSLCRVQTTNRVRQ